MAPWGTEQGWTAHQRAGTPLPKSAWIQLKDPPARSSEAWPDQQWPVWPEDQGTLVEYWDPCMTLG